MGYDFLTFVRNGFLFKIIFADAVELIIKNLRIASENLRFTMSENRKGLGIRGLAGSFGFDYQ